MLRRRRDAQAQASGQAEGRQKAHAPPGSRISGYPGSARSTFRRRRSSRRSRWMCDGRYRCARRTEFPQPRAKSGTAELRNDFAVWSQRVGSRCSSDTFGFADLAEMRDARFRSRDRLKAVIDRGTGSGRFPRFSSITFQGTAGDFSALQNVGQKWGAAPNEQVGRVSSLRRRMPKNGTRRRR